MNFSIKKNKPTMLKYKDMKTLKASHLCLLIGDRNQPLEEIGFDLNN